MIVVTDGTSDFSRLVVRHLLTRVAASEVAVAVADVHAAKDLAELGVDVRLADFADPKAATAVFAGAKRVLSSPPPGWIRSQAPQASIRQARACVSAAIAAQVPYIVHIGVINSGMTHLKWQHALDGAVRMSGIPFTVLRNNVQTEALTPAVQLALATDEFMCSFGDSLMAPAAATAYAEAAALVLTEDGHENRIYQLSGRLGFTALGIASAISLVADREIRLREVAEPELVDALKQAGASAAVARDLNDLYAATSSAEFAIETQTLEQLLGHEQPSLTQALRAALDAVATSGPRSHPPGRMGDRLARR